MKEVKVNNNTNKILHPSKTYLSSKIISIFHTMRFFSYVINFCRDDCVKIKILVPTYRDSDSEVLRWKSRIYFPTVLYHIKKKNLQSYLRYLPWSSKGYRYENKWNRKAGWNKCNYVKNVLFFSWRYQKCYLSWHILLDNFKEHWFYQTEYLIILQLLIPQASHLAFLYQLEWLDIPVWRESSGLYTFSLQLLVPHFILKIAWF